MAALTGDDSIWVFIGLTVVLCGGASWMMGQAMALTWRPPVHLVLYAALLAAADRFGSFALFAGELLSATGFLLDWAILGAIAFAAFRATQAAKMTQQYPWLFERSGPFGWRDKRG